MNFFASFSSFFCLSLTSFYPAQTSFFLQPTVSDFNPLFHRVLMGPELSMEKSLCQSFPEFISKKKTLESIKRAKYISGSESSKLGSCGLIFLTRVLIIVD